MFTCCERRISETSLIESRTLSNPNGPRTLQISFSLPFREPPLEIPLVYQQSDDSGRAISGRRINRRSVKDDRTTHRGQVKRSWNGIVSQYFRRLGRVWESSESEGRRERERFGGRVRQARKQLEARYVRASQGGVFERLGNFGECLNILLLALPFRRARILYRTVEMACPSLNGGPKRKQSNESRPVDSSRGLRPSRPCFMRQYRHQSRAT